MASISFDKSTGWWSVKYFAGPDVGRLKKTLCKHPMAWSKSKPPKRAPESVKTLAAPFLEMERQAKLGQNVAARSTDLRKYTADYITAYAVTRRPNSVNALRNAVDKFVAWCKSEGIFHVEAVTVQRCDAWIAHRLAEGAARSTVVTERGFLAPIWVQARRHRLIVENPWEVARVPGKPKEDDMKYWTVDELRKLFAACEGWVRDFAILDANSGLRVSALSGLTWADIDFAGGRIVIPTHLSKSGKSYSVPFTPTAQEVLARRWLEDKSKAPSALIFSGESTGKKIDRGQIWRRLKAAVKRAGIRDFGHYSHALRHSFAVALVGADIKIRVIQDFLGHSSLKTTEIYAKVSPDKAKAEMERFDISAAPVNPPPALDPTPGDPKAHPPAPDSGT